MLIYTPTRGELIAEIPLFCQVRPLARPRSRGRVRGVYQPLANQEELRHELSRYTPLRIDYPVLIDTYIQLAVPRKTRLLHPVGRIHGDEDNLRKAICDALVAQEILTDDAFILGGSNSKAFGPECLALIRIFAVTAKPDEVTPLCSPYAPIKKTP
jgi:Holliday junction resolvase RusA-like endonuclease